MHYIFRAIYKKGLNNQSIVKKLSRMIINAEDFLNMADNYQTYQDKQWFLHLAERAKQEKYLAESILRYKNKV